MTLTSLVFFQLISLSCQIMAKCVALCTPTWYNFHVHKAVALRAVITLKKKLENIPNWIINLLSVISAVITILTGILGAISFFSPKSGLTQYGMNVWLILLIIMLICLLVLVVSKAWKYRKLSKARIRSVSSVLHILNHEFRNMFFDILHEYKLGKLTSWGLTSSVERFLRDSLDGLCEIMKDYTGCDVCACIKLLEHGEEKEIEIDTATVTVFCRSKNSAQERKNMDAQAHKIFLRDDTALLEVSGDSGKDHFACKDLEKYKSEHSNDKNYYRNPNLNWEKFYRGTFVVPIRIEAKRLFYFKNPPSHHLIGYLCLDSLSTNAFLPNQEKYNAEIIKAFADIFYVALSKYSHYLIKLSDKEPKDLQSTGTLPKTDAQRTSTENGPQVSSLNSRADTQEGVRK